MRKILSVLFCLATLFGCVAPIDDQVTPVATTEQATTAAPVTVALPLFTSLVFATANPAVAQFPPPSWGFYAVATPFNDLYVPINVVPVGATINSIAMRVRGTTVNLCQFSLWQQPDLFQVNRTPIATSGLTGFNETVITLSANTSVTVASLHHYFVTLHTALVGGQESGGWCYVANAEVTYTPAG